MHEEPEVFSELIGAIVDWRINVPRMFIAMDEMERYGEKWLENNS